MSTVTLTQAAQGAPAGSVQLVTCDSGGLSLAILASSIGDTYQLTAEQVAADIDELETAEGALPIVSLAELLSHHWGTELEPRGNETSLVAVSIGDQRAAVRLGELSEPVAVAASRVHAMPRIARASDRAGIVKAIAVAPQPHEPSENALRLLIDLASAFGESEDSGTSAPMAEHPGNEHSVKPSEATGASTRQMLIFGNDQCTSAEFRFCLPLAAVAEVAAELPIFDIPTGSPMLLGYVLWRRVPVPVVDLTACFAVPTDELVGESTRGRRRLLVARAPANRFVGFHVHPQMNFATTSCTASSGGLESFAGRPVLGAFETAHGLLVVPDLGSILDNFGPNSE